VDNIVNKPLILMIFAGKRRHVQLSTVCR